MTVLSTAPPTKYPEQQTEIVGIQPTSWTSHTSAELAQSAATGFLLDHVGNQLIAGQPHLMISPTRATWIVPIHLAYLYTGPIGSVGVVAIDDETGLVVAWTPLDQIKAASRALRAAKEPSLTQKFQTFTATTNLEQSQVESVA